MLKFLTEQDESKCCGCGACREVCPQKAISMQKNTEGFMYPMVDTEKCTDCKSCERVCPETIAPPKAAPLEIYAVQNKNKAELFDSSSGGAFRLLADSVINQEGYVVGCVWNEKMEPVLMITDSIDGLKSMQGSKYLYSSTEHTYSQTKKHLDDGKLVLFTGTPCQCAGVLNYLGRSYETLLTMDFLCHGFPSQRAFDAYRKHCEQIHHNRKMSYYKCRDKSTHGWAISESYLINGKKHKAHGMTSPYLFGFINGYFNRYSCYTCSFRGRNRFTDYTVCDYWGYKKEENEQIDTHNGVSAFQVNTEKGKHFMTSFASKALMHLTDQEIVAIENPAILYDKKENIPVPRKTIYREIDKTGWKTVEKKYLRCEHFYLKKMWYALPDSLTQALKRMVKG